MTSGPVWGHLELFGCSHCCQPIVMPQVLAKWCAAVASDAIVVAIVPALWVLLHIDESRTNANEYQRMSPKSSMESSAPHSARLSFVSSFAASAQNKYAIFIGTYSPIVKDKVPQAIPEQDTLDKK